MTRGETTIRGAFGAGRFSALALALTVLVTVSGAAMEMATSLDEIAQTADLIFVGTVEESTSRVDLKTRMIFTDVVFGDLRIIHAKSTAVQRRAERIQLTFAGGSTAERAIVIAGNPRFLPGGRHLLFVRDDGAIYINPAIGGFQGHFQIMKDGASATEYVLSHDGRLVTGVGPDGAQTAPGKVSAIIGGRPVLADAPEKVQARRSVMPPPVPSDNDGTTAVNSRTTRAPDAESPLPLAAFSAYITEEALNRPIPHPRLRFGGVGQFVHEEDGELREIPFPKNSTPFRSLREFGGPESTAQKGGALYACGSQDLNLVMYQVPYPSPEWTVNNDSMWIWNLFMDVFRYKSSTGTWGDDSHNEFAGYVTEEVMINLIGGGWNGAIGMTVFETDNWPCECCGIYNSDVLLNPAYTFTDSDTAAIGNPNLVNMRGVVMHELGHVWGYMTNEFNPETYDYDQPSVMHAYYIYAVENGRGIHAADAYLFRRNYDDQTSVLPILDFGVESYYASDGLEISTTDTSIYHQGDPITISDVTIENMSSFSVQDLQFRLYLSDDRTIFDSDHEIGSHLFWPSFAAESHSVFSVSSTVPIDVPPGDYFVGALVSQNGLSSDDYYANNTTTLTDSVRILPLPPPWLSASDRRWDYRVRVTWDPVPGATGYDVYRKQCSGCTPVWIGNTVFVAYDDSDATAGTTPECTYFYGVRSDSVVGSGRMSVFDPGSSRFAAPASVTASEGLGDGVHLQWSPVLNAPSYRIWRSSDPLTEGDPLIVVGDVTSFTDATAPVGRRHYYRVAAINGCGEGPLSAAVMGHTGQLVEIFKDDFETQFTDRWARVQPSIWYADCDQDGYSMIHGTGTETTHDPGTPPRICSNGVWSPLAPTSMATRDCNDRNADAHPGQDSFYGTGYYPSGNPGGDDYDYNCDGAEEELSTVLSPSGDYISCIVVDSECVGNLPYGWVSFTVPVCGQTMTRVECDWVEVYPYLACQPVFTEVAQTCR